MDYRILVINPGSTPPRRSPLSGEGSAVGESISHTQEELAPLLISIHRWTSEQI